MALNKTLTTIHGFVADPAYIRVEGVNLIGKDKIGFYVRFYNDISNPSFQEVDFEIEYDLLGENPIAQAYAHLKSLPDFANAIDC